MYSWQKLLLGFWNGADAILTENFISSCLSVVQCEIYFHFPEYNVQISFNYEIDNRLNNIINASNGQSNKGFVGKLSIPVRSVNVKEWITNITIGNATRTG